MEKLNCLDKVWHKGCFNCEVCKMALSMKTYKGYNKLPYCNTHYPTTNFTAVAETPENLRLKKNTANQSGVVYQKEFLQEKGKITAVADDPESLRLSKAQKNASITEYQGLRKGSQSGAAAPPPLQAPQEPQAQPAAQQQQQNYPSKQRVEPPRQPSPEPVAVRYIAIYDYTAADDDEVSFQEGDVITDGNIIDEGWMTGTVQRTGENGMLPSNYVELE